MNFVWFSLIFAPPLKGVYILYPGRKKDVFYGFHEIIPGLGAFSVNPSNTHSGIVELGAFIDKVVLHLLDRTSQRERIANTNNDILSEGQSSYPSAHFRYPDSFDRKKINPEKLKVLVSYYREENKTWIFRNKQINLRAGKRRGSLFIEHYDYVLLHGRVRQNRHSSLK